MTGATFVATSQRSLQGQNLTPHLSHNRTASDTQRFTTSHPSLFLTPSKDSLQPLSQYQEAVKNSSPLIRAHSSLCASRDRLPGPAVPQSGKRGVDLFYRGLQQVCATSLPPFQSGPVCIDPTELGLGGGRRHDAMHTPGSTIGNTRTDEVFGRLPHVPPLNVSGTSVQCFCLQNQIKHVWVSLIP